MGGCNSREATVVAVATAKVIFPDGSLRECSTPMHVSDVLPTGKAADRGKVFLCNADHLEFGAYVSPVGSEEELYPGQIYFVLPKSMLRRPLSPEDMATLAVRASAALVKSGCDVAAATYVPVTKPRPAPPPVASTSEGRRRRKMSRGRSFSSDLLSIPEIE